MKKITEEIKIEQHKFLNKILVPILTFAIFLTPLIMDAVQIDVEKNYPLPVHWQLVMSGVFSGGVGTILTIMKRIYEKYQIDYDKEISDLKTQIKVLALGRTIDEKQIILNSSLLNDAWLEKNATIEQMENLLNVLKDKISKANGQKQLLEIATNNLTEKLGQLEPTELEKRLLEVDKELEQVKKKSD